MFSRDTRRYHCRRQCGFTLALELYEAGRNKYSRYSEANKAYIPHEAHTTSAYSERTRGNLGEVFVLKMCFRNTGCFRKCPRNIGRHSGLFAS